MTFFYTLYIKYFYSPFLKWKCTRLYSLPLFKMMLVVAIAYASFTALTILVPQSGGVIQTLFAQIIPASLEQSSDNSTTNLNNSNNSNLTQTSSILNSTGNSSSITQLATLPSSSPITPSSNGGSSNDNSTMNLNNGNLTQISSLPAQFDG